jgi:hypothetical protein
MLLNEIEVGDMLHLDYIDDITGDMASRPVLVLDTNPKTFLYTRNVPDVVILDRGEEHHVRSSQLWPIDGNDFHRVKRLARREKDNVTE